MNSGLYFGRVTHARAFPRRHRFSYRIWYLLADLDELDTLDRTVPGFRVDRPGPVSFWSRDHGPRDGSSLRGWAERALASAGVELEGGPIRILCFPRVLGYVFNPLSVWFCHHRDGRLGAIVYEVSNTFGEHHSYVVPVEDDARAGDRVRAEFDKELFVSPFIDMEARYDFTARVPDDRVSVIVHETVASGRVLTATVLARRVRLNGRGLARAFFGRPLVTAKVIGGIHREALQLWMKGVRYRHRGAPPEQALTTVGAGGSPRPGRRVA